MASVSGVKPGSWLLSGGFATPSPPLVRASHCSLDVWTFLSLHGNWGGGWPWHAPGWTGGKVTGAVAAACRSAEGESVRISGWSAVEPTFGGGGG
eukprot:scaffold2045_cov404-Prasinococcus_capsulatus_cf.AAC.79